MPQPSDTKLRATVRVSAKRRRWPLLLAAVVLVAGLVFLRWSPLARATDVAPTEPFGVGDQRVVLSPSGATSRLELLANGFAWPSTAHESTDQFVVTVREATAGKVVAKTSNLREPRWMPTADEIAGLPSAIEWTAERVRLGNKQQLGLAKLHLR